MSKGPEWGKSVRKRHVSDRRGKREKSEKENGEAEGK